MLCEESNASCLSQQQKCLHERKPEASSVSMLYSLLCSGTMLDLLWRHTAAETCKHFPQNNTDESQEGTECHPPFLPFPSERVSPSLPAQWQSDNRKDNR